VFEGYVSWFSVTFGDFGCCNGGVHDKVSWYVHQVFCQIGTNISSENALHFNGCSQHAEPKPWYLHTGIYRVTFHGTAIRTMIVEGCSDGIQTRCHRIQCITLETTILLMHPKVVVLTEAAVLVITDADYWRWLKETSFLRVVNHLPSVSGRSGIRQMWMCLLHAVGSAKSFLVSPLLHFSFVLLLFLSLPVRSHLDSVAPC